MMVVVVVATMVEPSVSRGMEGESVTNINVTLVESIMAEESKREREESDWSTATIDLTSRERTSVARDLEIETNVAIRATAAVQSRNHLGRYLGEKGRGGGRARGVSNFLPRAHRKPRGVLARSLARSRMVVEARLEISS